jgi:DNA-binding NtrC family response regulator
MAKLLIVDDEKNIRARLATFFKGCGHQVRTAENGQQALEELSEGEPIDLVLTDYKMAELDGLELLQQVKHQAPETAVILMTAYATIENAVATMKAGAFDYLPKPFSLEQIQYVVERALEVQNLRAENRALRDTL